MLSELASDIFLMADVCAVGANHVRVQIETAQREVRCLVAKEPSALLDGVSVPIASVARHVRDRQSLDGKPSIQLFAAHEDVLIGIVPVNLAAIL